MGSGEMAQWLKSPDWSSRGQGFNSQYPHGTDNDVTPKPSSGLCRQCLLMVYRHTHRQKHLYTLNFKKKSKLLKKYFYVCVCTWVQVCARYPCRNLQRSDPLELQLLVFVSHYMGAGNLESAARATSTVNHWVVPPVPSSQPMAWCHLYSKWDFPSQSSLESPWPNYKVDLSPGQINHEDEPSQ